jgi:hypothetical protein
VSVDPIEPVRFEQRTGERTEAAWSSTISTVGPMSKIVA